MKRNALPLAAALLLSGLILLIVLIVPLAGCSRRDEPPTVQAGKDSQGNPYVHVDGKQVNRDLNRAGKELKTDAKDLGKAIQDGAQKVDEKVGPVAREVLDDAGITARIRAKLLADPTVKSVHIGVDTVNGRVALNGEVATADQRAEAEKLASQTPGVKSVANLLQVAGQASPVVVPPATTPAPQ
jgi:hyperosmotically inducible periplasmic protein